MFIGFIPALATFVAALVSLRYERLARVLWVVSALLLGAWAAFHGSHHVSDLSTYGSW
jgi:hypothetical protein